MQSRLNGNRTPDKSLEPPQKPANYSRVEAFSDPNSESAKWFDANEKYKETLLQQALKQGEALFQQRQQDAEALEQQRVERENRKKFQEAIIAEGVAPEDFPDFWNTIQNSDNATLVRFYNWQKSQKQNEPQQRFNVPLGPSAGRRIQQSTEIPNDIGELLVAAQKQMM
jgi:predicted RNA-binding Zn ribbon-like protein